MGKTVQAIQVLVHIIVITGNHAVRVRADAIQIRKAISEGVSSAIIVSRAVLSVVIVTRVILGHVVLNVRTALPVHKMVLSMAAVPLGIVEIAHVTHRILVGRPVQRVADLKRNLKAIMRGLKKSGHANHQNVPQNNRSVAVLSDMISSNPVAKSHT
jgi:hypothetical protein